MYYTQTPKTPDLTIKISRQKPRAKEVNEILMSRKAGRMNDKDVGRNKGKEELRRALSRFSVDDFND